MINAHQAREITANTPNLCLDLEIRTAAMEGSFYAYYDYYSEEEALRHEKLARKNGFETNIVEIPSMQIWSLEVEWDRKD